MKTKRCRHGAIIEISPDKTTAKCAYCGKILHADPEWLKSQSVVKQDA